MDDVGEPENQIFEAVVSVPYGGGYFHVRNLCVGRAAIWAEHHFLMTRAQCVGGAIELARVGASPRVLLLQRRRARRERVWFVDVLSPEVGHALLLAAGVDSRQRRLEVRSEDPAFLSESVFMLSAVLSSLPWMVLAIFVDRSEYLNAAVALVIAVVLPLLGLIARDALRAQTLVIGIDGLWIPKGRAGRFLSFASIRSVGPPQRNFVDLELQDGTTQRLVCTVDTIDLVSARLRQAMLEGKQKPLATADQMTTPMGPAHYRVSAADGPSLDRAIVDPAASLETRAAAAMALRARGPSQLRVAVDVTASPETRKILERIEAGADAEEVAAFVRKRSG